MTAAFSPHSVGIVAPERIHFPEPITLASGASLGPFDLQVETYGALNDARSNAILICHALSGDHHAAGYHSSKDKKPGWWDNAIGPGKPIDTDRFFVVCPNNLGGCAGSTGPSTVNPATGEPFGPDFPLVTVRDWVKSQHHLMRHYGIDRWAAVAGGSLGGMQALQWSIDYPQAIAHALVIAAAPFLSTQNIAFNEVARQAIRSDPNFAGGRYYGTERTPVQGLALARMLGHITYLSDDVLEAKFGREQRGGGISYGFDVEFQIESYLRYQGQQFVNRFDANSYLLMTKTLDYFDPAAGYDGDLPGALTRAEARFLVLSFSSDWRFSPERSREIVRALLDADRVVSYAEIESELGHDSFLLPIPRYHELLRAYLGRVADEVGAPPARAGTPAARDTGP